MPEKWTKTCRRCDEVRTNEDFTCEWCGSIIDDIVYCDGSYHFCSEDCFTEARKPDFEDKEFEDELACAETDIIFEEVA